MGLDYGWSFRLLRADLDTKPFIWVGASALLILAALAATSFVVWKRRLGKNWKRLHRLVYVAVLLVVVHFAWARKANLATLSGDIALPLVAASRRSCSCCGCQPFDGGSRHAAALFG